MVGGARDGFCGSLGALKSVEEWRREMMGGEGGRRKAGVMGSGEDKQKVGRERK